MAQKRQKEITNFGRVRKHMSTDVCVASTDTLKKDLFPLFDVMRKYFYFAAIKVSLPFFGSIAKIQVFAYGTTSALLRFFWGNIY